MSSLPRTPQTIARTVQDLLHAISAGSVRNTYPKGAGTKPVPVELTPAERAVAASQLADVLQEWGDVDPEGRNAWETAFLQDAEADPETYAGRHGRRPASIPAR
ncbi:hypothetical protein OG413_40005 [Streptomyces sp. NBC_01433]|uniref:hypothetical protein n=1 Tax=Streptomyces sp. NBC_01433 TaxID=2903864 RepID=UPI00224EDD84|nr:hypothetical protein [Streptomyces sp. NBC_01433]MCX4681383.1 hypothetical protein [Streptomyces sp. NBC_01433]